MSVAVTEKDLNWHTERVLAIRNMRRLVLQAGSMVSPGGRIKEKIGTHWAANFEARTIMWTPVSPLPPGDELLTTDEALFISIHEAGHLEYTGRWNVPDEVDGGETNQDYHSWVNCIEDMRIERAVIKTLPGYAEMRDGFYQKVFAGIHMGQLGTYGSLQQAEMALLAVYAGIEMEQLKGELTPAVYDWVERRWPDLDKIVDGSPSTDDLQRRAFPLYKELMSEVVPANERGQGGKKTDLGTLMEEIAKAVEEALSDGRGFFVSDGEAECDSGGGIRQMSRPGNSYAHSLAGALEDEARGDGLDEPDTDQEDLGGVTAGRGAGGSRGTSAHAWDDIKGRHRNETSRLAHQLRAVLRSNAQQRHQEGHRRGQLNTRRAFKSAYGNQRIFRQQREIGGLNYVVGIMPDCSSSMASMERRSGVSLIDPVVMIAEACQQAGIEWFVVGWDDGLVCGKHVRSNLTRGVKRTLVNGIRPKGGTYEAYALLEAERQLKFATPGAVPILFTITDGETIGVEESSEILESLRQRYGAHDISIYLGGGRQRHHSHNINVPDITSLATEVPALLKSIIRRKHW